MTRKKHDPDNKARITVVCSTQQAEILDEAARTSGAPDRSMWMLAHCMKAASSQNLKDTPLVISGDVADRLRGEAARQGITPEQALQQLLLVQG